MKFLHLRAAALRAAVLASLLAGCVVRAPAPAPRYDPPPPPPERWEQLLGEYVGPDSVVVLERDGSIQVLRTGEWVRILSVIRGDTFRIAGTDTLALFSRDSARVTALRIGDLQFRRVSRAIATTETFRIEPLRPVAELREEALAARPPLESDSVRGIELVELAALDTTILLDIRYATDDNFMGAAFYSEPRAFLQRPAAEALVRVGERLRAIGYGLIVFDAYRPWYVTKMFWDATPDSLRHFVADPSRGSRHNRGAAVDLTLYDLRTRQPVEMVSGYDEFTPRAAADYPGSTSRRRWHRDLLRMAMEAEGFTVYEHEWWHFDYRDWQRYPVINLPFERIPGAR